MVKNPELLRERVVLSEANAMCKGMQARVSTYFPDEDFVIEVLNRRGPEDLALAICELVMERFASYVGTARGQR